MRPSLSRPASRFAMVTGVAGQAAGEGSGDPGVPRPTPAGQTLYVVVPVGGIRFLSYALEAIRCTPCVHMVPMLIVVFGIISRWISRFDSIMYGIRKLGSTIERFDDAPKLVAFGRAFGKVGVC